jgi:hypothetical protein
MIYKKTISIPILLKGFQMLRLLGPQLFLEKVRYQVFSRIPHLCLGKELDKRNISSESPEGVILLPASSENVQQFFRFFSRLNFKETVYEKIREHSVNY